MVLGAATPVPAPARPAPEAFVSHEGRFTVAFPAAPEHDGRARDSWAGPVREGNYELEQDGVWLRVEFHDIPRIATLVMSPRSILDRASDSLIEDVAAQAPEVEPTSLRGHPGVVVRYQPTRHPGSVEEARLYLVGTRLYVAFARAPRQAAESAEAFLASFDVWEP